MEMEYASKAVGTGALTTGIIGTALGVLNGGVGLMNGGYNRGYGGYGYEGGYGHYGCGHFATKDDLNYVREISTRDAEIALLKSEQNTEVKIADVYERIMTRVNADAKAQADWNASQSVINAKLSSAIATNENSIQSLRHTCDELTKVVIPIENVCPRPMQRYNSWTAPVDE